MSWKRLLLGLALVLLLLAGGLVAWLWNTDLGRFKDSLQAQVLARTGADLRMTQLSILLGPELSISGQGLTVDNPAWPGDQRVLSVERFALTFDLWSLFDQGPVQVLAADVSGVDLDLQRDAQGASNLVFRESDDTDTGPEQGPPLPLLVRQAQVEDFHLEWLDASRAAPVRVTVESLALDTGDDEMVHTEVNGSVNDQPARYTGRIGPFPALLSGGQVEFDGIGRFGSLALEGLGTIDRLASPDRPELELTVSGPDIREVERMLGLAPDKPGPYHLRLESGVQGPDWGFRVEGRIAELELDISGTADGLRSAERFELDIQGQGPDLASPLRLFGVMDAPAEPFGLSGRLRREGLKLDAEDVSLVIGETTLALQAGITNFPHVRDSRVTLEVRGPDMAAFRTLLDLHGIAEGPFSLALHLQPVTDGHDQVRGHLETRLGALDVAGTVSDHEAYEGTELQLKASGERGGRVLAVLGVPGFPDDPFALETAITVGDGRLEVASARLEGVLEAVFEASGVIALAPWGAASGGDGGTSLQVRATGEDLAASLAAHEWAWPLGGGAFDFAASLSPLDQGLRLDDFEGRLGSSTLQGDARIPFRADLLGLALQLRAQGPDLTQLLAQLGGFHPGAAPFELSLAGGVGAGAWKLEPSWLNLGDARLAVEGTFDRLPDFTATNLGVSLDAPSLAALGTWQAHPLPDAPLSVEGRLAGGPTDLWLDGLKLASGESLVDGHVRYSLEGDVPRLSLDLASKRIDLRAWLPAPGNGTGEPDPPSGDGRLIPDLPLPLAALATLDAEIKLAFGEIETHQRIMTSVDVDAGLAQGALAVHRYHARGLAGDMTATARLTPVTGDRAELHLEMLTVGLVPVREAWRNVDPATLPRIDARAGLRAEGANLRELAASANGDFRIVASEGTLPGKGLGTLNLGLLQQLVTILIPGYTLDRPAELYCFAAHLKAENGLLSTEPVAALSTDRVLVVGSGTINLADETLDLGFKTTPTKLLGVNLAELVNPFVRIRGTMADPRPEVDPAGTLIYGGAAWATAGLSIVAKGLWDRIQRSQKPCEGLREELRASTTGVQ